MLSPRAVLAVRGARTKSNKAKKRSRSHPSKRRSASSSQNKRTRPRVEPLNKKKNQAPNITEPVIGLACKIGGTSIRFCVDIFNSSKNANLFNNAIQWFRETANSYNTGNTKMGIKISGDTKRTSISLTEISNDKTNPDGKIKTTGKRIQKLFKWFGKLTKLAEDEKSKLFLQLSWPGKKHTRGDKISFEHPNIKIDESLKNYKVKDTRGVNKPNEINPEMEILHYAQEEFNAKDTKSVLFMEAQNDAATNVEAGEYILLNKALKDETIKYKKGDPLVSATLGTGANCATLQYVKRKDSNTLKKSTHNHEIGRKNYEAKSPAEELLLGLGNSKVNYKLFEECFARGTKPNIESPNNGVLGMIKRALLTLNPLATMDDSEDDLGEDSFLEDNLESMWGITNEFDISTSTNEFFDGELVSKPKEEIRNLTYKDIIKAVYKNDGAVINPIFKKVGERFGAKVAETINKRFPKDSLKPRHIIINGGFFDVLMKEVEAFRTAFFEQMKFEEPANKKKPRRYKKIPKLIPISIEPKHYDGTRVLMEERIKDYFRK